MAPSTDPTTAFFDELASMGDVPLLHSTSGTIRIDLIDNSDIVRWYITIERGNVKVSHRNAKADAVMRTEKKLFDGMAKGTVNATTAMLRGVLGLEGDLGLVASLARMLPGPPRSLASFLERQKETAQ
jgi:predicted lipid carrier protein YhbT